MNIFEGIVAFVIMWWLVLFTVLPWGNSGLENPEVGHEPGAPAKPRLWMKIGITTLITTVLMLALWGLIHSGWISFRPSDA